MSDRLASSETTDQRETYACHIQLGGIGRSPSWLEGFSFVRGLPVGDPAVGAQTGSVPTVHITPPSFEGGAGLKDPHIAAVTQVPVTFPDPFVPYVFPQHEILKRVFGDPEIM